MAENRKFWTTASGMTGAVFLTAIVAGLGYIGLKFLPSIETILASNLYLGMLVGVLSLVVFTLVDSDARNIVRNTYLSIMRAITGVFIKMDPISVLKSYLDGLAENINELSIQIGELRGQMRSLNAIIKKNDADIKKNLLLAEKAKAGNRRKELILTSRKAGRLKESNEKYALLDKKMQHLYSILTRMYEHSEILHEDTQDQVTLKEIEYKAILASQKAMKGAKSVISGGSKKDLFDQSMQHILDDISQKSGEMERFMDLSKNFMDTMDLESAAFESEGMDLLESFNSTLLGGQDTLDLNKKPKRERERLRREDDDSNEYEGLF